MKLPKLPLHTKILLGLVLGIVVGGWAEAWGTGEIVSAWLNPIGQVFLQLIRMAVIPLVFASLVAGVASMHDTRRLGRIGGKTLLFYLGTTTVAITFGLLLAIVLRPGAGLSAQTQEQLLTVATADTPLPEPRSLTETLQTIVPANPIRAVADGEMLPLIFFALALGVALTLIPEEKARPVAAVFDGLNDAMIALIRGIMRLAPYGVFALCACMVARLGLDVLGLLMKYTAVVVAGLAVYMVAAFSILVSVLGRRSPRTFFRGIRPAQLIAFSTSSSSATLPVTMQCVEENLGVPREVAGLTLPLGATINMDGTALYQGVSAVFLIQVYGLDLTLAQQLTIVLTATLASIGTAGAPAAGILMLAIILREIGIPLEGLALIFGVERLLDMCRTVVNVSGDACCAVVVAASEATPRQ